MRPSPRPITNHHLARLNAWARLWLVWFAGVFALFCERGEAERTLRRIARGVRGLIILNAAARMPRLAATRDRHGRLHRATQRRIAGASLRRALGGKGAPTRFFAILAAMHDAEAHLGKILRRLARGLTRRALRNAPTRGAHHFSAHRAHASSRYILSFACIRRLATSR